VIDPRFTPGYAATPAGFLHYVEYGKGRPLLLLHQVPRTWDEFHDVMLLLGGARRTIAMDVIGFGSSTSLSEHSIETYAESVIALIDALELTEVDLLGHGMGGVIAVEVSHRAPERLHSLILSATPYVDEECRGRRRAITHPWSIVELQDDGRHLTELWVRRSGFYPPARPDLLDRFVRDALLLEDQAEDGHYAITNYEMEGRTTFRGPTLCIGATDDPISFDEVPRLHAQLPKSELAVIEGGMVPLMEHMPDVVADLVTAFLDRVGNNT
jgi:pimeloyl-ACP methyl ester carboxylesterase